MRILAFVLLGAASIVSAAAACSGSSTSSGSDGGGGADPFVGTYGCTGAYTLAFTAPAGRPAYNGNSSFTSVHTDNGDGTYTSNHTNDAGEACTLKHSFTGNTSTLIAGQACTLGKYTNTYTGGSATVSGGTITGSTQWTFTGTVDADGGSVSASGTGTGQNTCTRQ